MNGSELLHEAGKLIASGWCQGAEARGLYGDPVDVCAGAAARWSLLGSLQAAAYGDASTAIEDIGLAVAAIAELIIDPSLAHWNDDPSRTERDVGDLLWRAERLATKQLAWAAN